MRIGICHLFGRRYVGERASKSARGGIWNQLMAIIVAAILDIVIGHLLGNVPGVELPFTYTVLLCPLVVVRKINRECSIRKQDKKAAGI